MKPTTIGESLYWSYANLAMAHAAVSSGVATYGRPHYMIRSRLFKGLCTGAMDLGSLVDDERLKLEMPRACCYCGTTKGLSLDHLIASSMGGRESADNIVWCCRTCNSSKGARDMLVWLFTTNRFPPLLLLRRYLKLAIESCRECGLMTCVLSGKTPSCRSVWQAFRMRSRNPRS